MDDAGNEREADVLVVGANGLGSRVRDLALPADAWCLADRPTVAWSFWTDREVPDATVDVWTPGAEAFVTRVGDRGLVNVGAAMAPEEAPSRPAIGELERVARKLGWEVPRLVAARAGEPFVDRRRGRVEELQRAARFEERATFAESRLLGVVRNALVAHTPVLEWFVERQGTNDDAAWPGASRSGSR